MHAWPITFGHCGIFSTEAYDDVEKQGAAVLQQDAMVCFFYCMLLTAHPAPQHCVVPVIVCVQ
jgi:hypothetical protein